VPNDVPKNLSCPKCGGAMTAGRRQQIGVFIRCECGYHMRLRRTDYTRHARAESGAWLPQWLYPPPGRNDGTPPSVAMHYPDPYAVQERVRLMKQFHTWWLRHTPQPDGDES